MKRRSFLATGLAAGAAPATGLATPAIYVVPEEFRPRIVRVKRDFTPNSIVVVSAAHHLYWIMEDCRAIRYGVAVGQAGLTFRGSGEIARKVKWPSWTPTAEMIARTPSYARWAGGMPGGPTNPLGSRALYLYRNGRDTAIRIHGTTEPQSIGRSVSNGCIRMINAHVEDLYDRVPLGTPVTVY